MQPSRSLGPVNHTPPTTVKWNGSRDQCSVRCRGQRQPTSVGCVDEASGPSQHHPRDGTGAIKPSTNRQARLPPRPSTIRKLATDTPCRATGARWGEVVGRAAIAAAPPANTKRKPVAGANSRNKLAVIAQLPARPRGAVPTQPSSPGPWVHPSSRSGRRLLGPGANRRISGRCYGAQPPAPIEELGRAECPSGEGVRDVPPTQPRIAKWGGTGYRHKHRLTNTCMPADSADPHAHGRRTPYISTRRADVAGQCS